MGCGRGRDSCCVECQLSNGLIWTTGVCKNPKVTADSDFVSLLHDHLANRI